MKSFQNKLLAFFIPFYLLFSIATSSFYIVHNQSVIKENIIENGTSVVKTLSHACEFGVVTYDVTLLEWATKEVIKDKRVLMTVVYDFNGNIIMENNRLNIDSTFPETDINHLQKKRGAILKRQLTHENKIKYFDFIAPVHQIVSKEIQVGKQSHMPKIIGYIKMSISREELEKESKNAIYHGFIIGIIFLIIGI